MVRLGSEHEDLPTPLLFIFLFDFSSFWEFLYKRPKGYTYKGNSYTE